MATGIYVRISQDRAGAGLGVERQERDCRALAERLGWTVSEVYVDNDVSAYSGKTRPAYRRLLADIAAGHISSVVAWHTDRLHRSPVELEEFVPLCDTHKVSVQTVTAGPLDLSTPSGRMVARMLGATARYEVEHKSERTRRAQRQASEAGKWLGGARPFGWELNPPRLHDTEAPLVIEACADILAGRSLGSIAKRWNEAGVTTSYGKAWVATTVRQVLLRARNAGLATWHGEVVGTSQLPAIVDEDTWRGVVAVLTDPARRRSSPTGVKWLLAGIARCECGGPLRSASMSNRDGTKRTIYRCRTSGAGHVYVGADDLDTYVSDVIAGVLAGQQLIDPSPVDPRDLAGEAAALRARLDEAADSFADGTITKAQLERISSRLTDSLAAVEARLADRAREGALDAYAGQDGAARWRSAPIDAQRAVLRQIADVTVLRAGRGPRAFNPERVEVVAAGTRWPAAQD